MNYFQLSGLTGRMVEMVNSNSDNTARLCSDIDAQLARSRRVMQTASSMMSQGRLSQEKWREIEQKVNLLYNLVHLYYMQ